MSISNISNSAGPYSSPTSATSNNTSVAPATNSTSAAAPIPTTATSSPASIVTLSNGHSMTVIPGELKSVMPLTEAWGPQMFFQADSSKNEKLTSSEFADQLKRIGVSAETASKLFKTFDTSNDAGLSVDEYVAGIRSINASGNTMFSDLMNSYSRSPDGQIDNAAQDNFLKQGEALATKYWSSRS